MTITAKAVGYTRRIATRLPRFTRARIANFLSHSIWDPIVMEAAGPNLDVISPPPIRFVEARNAKRATALDVRSVLVRRIDVRKGVAMVEVDGDVFVLERCDADLPIACLTLRSDLSFDAPVQPTQFAKPPPGP